jgi:type IV fimbrial biogenesis protein FimT
MMKRIYGFTLIELMMTLTIAVILLTVGIPSFNTTIRNSRMANYVNQFVSALNLARSEALKRNNRVTVLRTGGNWEDGWQVLLDKNSNRVVDDDDEIIRIFDAFNPGYTLRTQDHFSDWIAFMPTGESVGKKDSLDNEDDIFRLCSNEQIPSDGRSISINMSGRIKTNIGTSSCP